MSNASNNGSAKSPSSTSAIGRRMILKGAALAMSAGAAAPALVGAASAQTPPVAGPGGQNVIAKAGTAIVDIETGKIAGAIFRGIYSFKGIPYGDTTAGENRFQPAKKPAPWQGIRSCRSYGAVCPQDKGTGRMNDEEAFMFQWCDSYTGEDCLRVNVWTPGIADNKKRPVMVWLHGGGFAAGSGNDLPCFDGENLSRRGDVVVVTLNHRLNLLGFMDLSKYGEKYALSGNVGMLDIVTALQWVHDNIAVFGGDPSRVLVFGQSGGGAKVSTLMGMPAAKGLFHRAVVQSGSFSLSTQSTQSQKLTDLVLAELGIDASSIGKLHTLPYETIRLAAEAVMARNNPRVGVALSVTKMGQMLNFGPVIDGKTIPAPPFGDKASALSADVPMMIGTTLNEFANGMNNPGFEALTEAELETRVEQFFPGKAKTVIAIFRARTPDAKPADLFSRIATAPVRRAAIKQATSKAALGKAPAYLYWFHWQTPMFDGRPRAFHCAELPFVFFNTDRMENMTGGGPVPMALSEKMADTWIQFARTGDPNHAGIPSWTKFAPKTAACMIWDNDVKVLLNPDGEEMKAVG
jgi:para-nitrobenzyl esterase